MKLKLRILVMLVIASLSFGVVETTAAPRGKARTTKSKTNKAKKASKADNDEVLEVAEVMPKFPGGDEAMSKWIKDNIRYPAEAKNLDKAKRVIVKFTVTKTGAIKDAEVIRSISPALDREALRLVNSMPKFSPGKMNGKPVNVHVLVPIIFEAK